MELIKINNLSFTYKTGQVTALKDIDLVIGKGEFVTLCGKSGCGKTTLLRLLKPSISPFGEKTGEIFYKGEPILKISELEDASKIGFVMQNPDSQLITEKVWSELAFGLESLGFPNGEIRRKVSEMVSFFGIEDIFHKKTSELSGGQKQIVNLASVLVMQPDFLILDEPTSQLDPICASDFIKTLEKINRELGITVILSEHRLEEAFPVSDRIIVMDGGKIICDTTPQKAGKLLKGSSMFDALPAPVRIFSSLCDEEEGPITVREGKKWLSEALKNKMPVAIPANENNSPVFLQAKDLWFKYDDSDSYVIKGAGLSVKKGEFFALLGGNGAGKSTLISLLGGLVPCRRGKIIIDGKDIKKHKGLYDGFISILPQNPLLTFSENTVLKDIKSSLINVGDEEINEAIRIFGLEKLTDSHPYDLSGGEQQKLALCKVFLRKSRIVFLDEPTKGLDVAFKKTLAGLIKKLNENSVTVIMVSHDIEFSAEYASRCALFFDGNVTALDEPYSFFKNNYFYTTGTNRLARDILPGAILPRDIINAFKGEGENE